jgi:hypothetical protein
MDAERTIDVRLIEGAACLVPLAARENSAGTFRLSVYR